MAKFVYPAKFYYNEEYDNYSVAFADVGIFTDGATIEEAYQRAQEFLLSYLDCCEQLAQNPETPSNYLDVVKNAEDATVMLVSVDYQSKRGKKGKQEVQTDFGSDIFEDFENILAGGGDDDFSLPSID